MVCPRVPKPDLPTERLKMIFPDVPIALRRRRPLVLLNPRQIDALHEITDGNHTLVRGRAGVAGGHVPLGFGLDIGRRPHSPGGYQAKRVTHSLACHLPADIAPLPVPHVPAASNSDNLPILLALTH